MIERHRFEVDQKGEAYDIGIRDLRNRLHPLLEEAREIVQRNPEVAGKENDLVYTLLSVRFTDEELKQISEQLASVTSTATYISEDGTESESFMQGGIEWAKVVQAARERLARKHA